MAEEECFTLETKGILLPVSDQGECQCCYAFAGTGCVSSLFASEYGLLMRLSVHELVDWLHEFYPPKPPEPNGDIIPDEHGCYQNTNNNTFRYMRTRGISLEEQYPYTGRKGEPQNTEHNTKIRIGGFYKVKDLEWDEEDIKSQIRVQPLAGVIELYQSFRELQTGEMYTGPKPNEKAMGFHAVQVIGYGIENGIECYKILNSWGKSWGTNGFAKVRQDLIIRLSFPYTPSLDKDNVKIKSASKVKQHEKFDINTKKDGSSRKKTEKPGSSSSKEKRQSKIQKMGRSSSLSHDTVCSHQVVRMLTYEKLVHHILKSRKEDLQSARLLKLDKSEHVMVVLKGPIPNAFGGAEQPAAYSEVVSIGGLSLEANKKLSAAIANILETKLNVPKSRFFLKFYDTKYVMLVPKGYVPIACSGTEQSAAYGELVPVGSVDPDVNKKLSVGIAELLETKLNIPKLRFILMFYHSKVRQRQEYARYLLALN